jgi:hypothetical protein
MGRFKICDTIFMILDQTHKAPFYLYDSGSQLNTEKVQVSRQ